ncbi:putative RNA methyltransferase [Reinekea sp.]|jgi:23S rRNA (guanine745-N1)-methyltransferase|uniref:putative RNA methyltransferase n=1 Tax=Reinekea sp. TaxID=1970455 RepID=UPI002A7F2E93|nr:methyltransferase domain-containing protein [Reinekea sp.]
MLASPYICPVCALPLESQLNTLRCAAQHSFDRHKKGYVNLLLAQNKNSKAPGDDALMVQSRRRFLEAGHYQTLAERISTQMAARLPADARVWDAGCGEGYYTQTIARANADFDCYGLDISKPAIVAASKYKNIHWSVASSTHAPYADASFDALVSVFSRVDSDPFHRVLKPGGAVCMVTPDFDHLMALRQLIYQTVRPYDVGKHQTYLDNRFELVHEERLTFALDLPTNQAIFDLLGMTPHAHRLSHEAQDRLKQTPALPDRACFKLYWFVKTEATETAP